MFLKGQMVYLTATFLESILLALDGGMKLEARTDFAEVGRLPEACASDSIQAFFFLEDILVCWTTSRESEEFIFSFPSVLFLGASEAGVSRH